MLSFADIQVWYSRSDVKFQIIKYTYNREFALLVPNWCPPEIKKNSIRTLKCHNVQSFDYIMKEGLRVYEKHIPYNMYYSLSKYINGVPNQTFNFSLRDNTEWNLNCYKHSTAHDFLIDIDAGAHSDIMFAYDSAKEIINLLAKLNVPYELVFSGKGFHIIIQHYYFSHLGLSLNPTEEHNLYKLYRKIAEKLAIFYSEMIDTSIYDSRRICKIPYTLSIYKEDIFVAYQFMTREEFDKFELNNFNIDKFSESLSGRNRKIFNPEGSILPLLDYFNISYYILDNGEKHG